MERVGQVESGSQRSAPHPPWGPVACPPPPVPRTVVHSWIFSFCTSFRNLLLSMTMSSHSGGGIHSCEHFPLRPFALFLKLANWKCQGTINEFWIWAERNPHTPNCMELLWFLQEWLPLSTSGRIFLQLEVGLGQVTASLRVICGFGCLGLFCPWCTVGMGTSEDTCTLLPILLCKW